MKRLYPLLICLGLSSPLTAQEAPGIITTIANYSGGLIRGPGMVGGGGGIDFDTRGNLYVGPQRIYLPDGVVKSLLGGDPLKIRDFGDGLSAALSGFVRSTTALESSSSLLLTAGLAVDLKGNVYIAAPFDQRIRWVDSNGTIRTVAGSGDREFPNPNATSGDVVRGGFSGDGGPATQAQLNRPADVTLDAQGNFYIADCGNGRIRLVNREGFISTFAGNGGRAEDPLGDGGAAILAVLVTPVSVAVDLKGNVYVAELYAHRVRKIAADNPRTITTLAGTGEAGYSGDGGPAAQARLNFPMGVAVDIEGNVYIADRENHRVRKVDPNGTITTFAGNGRTGVSGDGGPVVQARVENPRDVLVDPRGYVYISHDEHRGAGSFLGHVRRVSPLKPFEVPSIRLSATSLPFEATSVNTPVEQTLTVSNAGKETPLLVEVVLDRSASEFKVISPTNFLVQPGESQAVTVRFTPTVLRSRTSNLSVYHNGAEEKPLTVILNAVPGTAKSADFDGDGKVGFEDFFLFAAAFGQSASGDNARFDLDGSGKIDFDDFFLFAGRFGR